MSVISTAPAASSAASLFVQGHKKGGRSAITDAGDDSAQGSTTSTQGLFSSLLQSFEQIAGISTSSAATAAAGTKAVTGAAATGAKAAAGTNPAAAYGSQPAGTGSPLASAGAQLPRTVGANLNTSA